MCLGIPGEVIEVLADRPDLARVCVGGVRRAINVALLADDPPGPGDWVLIHVGFALSKIDEAEARAELEFLQGLGAAYADEIDAIRQSATE
jgi:hydrogenase expression/formation protein HypC